MNWLVLSTTKGAWTWRIVISCLIATAALGVWGLLEAPGAFFWNDLYQLTDLYSFSFPLELGTANWQLQVARFLGPIATAAALIAGIVAFTRRRHQAWQAHRRQHHAVVLGLGDRGSRIAAALATPHRRVVGVELNPDTVGVDALRRDRGLVVEGDARLPAVLEQAGIAKAAHAVVVCGDDATNVDVVAAIKGLERSPALPPLRLFVHLNNAGLCALLRHQSLDLAAGSIRCDFFDVYSAGARMLLDEHPLEAAARDVAVAAGAPVRPHLVVVGLGQFGRCVVVVAARRHRDGALEITVVERDAGARLEAMLLAHPDLADHVAITAVDLDFDRPRRGVAARSREMLRTGGVTTVVICFDDDARSIATAMLVRRRLEGRPASVIARTSGTQGLSRLLEDRGATPAGITPFPLLARTCTRAVVEGGTLEQLARAMHDDYCTDHPGERFAVPWPDLPAEMRESNRSRAGAIAGELAAVGCYVVPLGGWGDPAVSLTDEEVELLARREHERWLHERVAQGWTYAPARSDSLKQNDKLLPWHDLPAEVQDRNRTDTRRLRDQLARTDLEVLRGLAPDVTAGSGSTRGGPVQASS